jgi:hypothetical protein
LVYLPTEKFEKSAKKIMKISHTIGLLTILLVCFGSTMGQLNRGSFKSNVMSYISQVELKGFATRELLFDLESDFKACEVTIEYFSRYHWDVPKGTSSLRCQPPIFPNKNSLGQRLTS